MHGHRTDLLPCFIPCIGVGVVRLQRHRSQERKRWPEPEPHVELDARRLPRLRSVDIHVPVGIHLDEVRKAVVEVHRPGIHDLAKEVGDLRLQGANPLRLQVGATPRPGGNHVHFQEGWR